MEWVEEAELWRRVVSSIDVITTNDGLLQDPSHTLVTVDEEGNVNAEGQYYVYIPEQTVFARDSENDRIAKGAAGNQPGRRLYKADLVYLIPKADYDGGDWSFRDGYQALTKSFVVAYMPLDPDGGKSSSGEELTSDYIIKSWYETVDLVFGVGSQNSASGFSAPEQLYDRGPVTVGGKTLSEAELAAHTAQFTLKHGEALLFNGLISGGAYRVTEVLTEAQLKAGWDLRRKNESLTSDNINQVIDVAVRHVQQNQFVHYNHKGEITDICTNGSIWSSDAFGSFTSTAAFQRSSTLDTFSVFGQGSAEEEAVQYQNLLLPAPLEISKDVVDPTDPGISLADDVYTFTVKLKNADGTPLTGTYHAYIHPTDHANCKPDQMHKHLEGDAGRCENDVILNGEGSFTFTLKKGETIVIPALPQGAIYTVEEAVTKNGLRNYRYDTPDITVLGEESGQSATADKFSVTGSLNTSLNEDDTEITRVSVRYLNKVLEPLKLTVSKTVIGAKEAGAEDVLWDFTLRLTPPDGVTLQEGDLFPYTLTGAGIEGEQKGSLTLQKTTAADGKTEYFLSFQLKHGQQILIEDLHYGIVYQAAETAVSGYKITVEVNGVEVTPASNQTGENVLSGEDHVHFTNAPLGPLAIEKVVVATRPGDVGPFRFTVTLRFPEGVEPDPEGYPYWGATVAGIENAAKPADGVLTLTKGTDENGNVVYQGTVNLGHGQRVVITGLPAGTAYQVEEDGQIEGFLLNRQTGTTGTVPTLAYARDNLNDVQIPTAHFENTELYRLPGAGGIGTMHLTLAGCLLIGLSLPLTIHCLSWKGRKARKSR